MWKILFIPLSILYGYIVSIRNKLFDLNIIKSKEFDFPVISVGNITVGGTGKTPHIEYLINLLKDNYRLATLSRGYKRSTKGFVLADKYSNVNEIGDEPKQIKQKFQDIIVAVDENRVNGITTLRKLEKRPDIVLLDDAFQHRYVKPGLSILLVDYHRPIFKDSMLPSGELREKWYEKKRAHIVIVTKTPNDIKPIDQRIFVNNLKLFPYQSLYFSVLKFGSLTPVFNSDQIINQLINDDGKKEYSILLITGIAQPVSFVNYIKQFAFEFHLIKYPDHHNYSLKNIDEIITKFDSILNPKKLIITTEKDSVRLNEYENRLNNIKQFIYYIPLQIEFLNGGKENFKSEVLEYVRTNKRHNRSYTKYNFSSANSRDNIGNGLGRNGK